MSMLRSLRIQAIRLALIAVLPAACREESPSPRAEAPPSETEAEAPPTARMAITIDDVPWIGATAPGESPVEATDRMLVALESQGARAVGFVNCGRVAPDAPILRRWLARGMQLGNHSEHHRDLNRVRPSQWADDVRSCDAFVRRVTGREQVYFRYPYLHRGPTAERRAAGFAVLAELNSPIAPVTIDTSDWILAVAYGDALRAGDDMLRAEIGEAFLEHVIRATRHYQEVAREKVGRDVSHVLLLHANALVADYIEPLLARLRDEGFEFITLDEALTDEVYERPDDYIGPLGLSWLYRMQPATPEMQEWDDAEAAELRERFRQ